MTVPAIGLMVAPCNREAVLWAVLAHHYSRSLPAGRMQPYGVWEDGAFTGAVVFSRGAASNIGRPFNLGQDQIAELTRLALSPHRTATSRIVSIACRLLKRQSPGLRLLVSYADPAHGHDGRGVYAAAGWCYLGRTNRERLIVLHGHQRHARTISSRYGTRSLVWLRANVDPSADHVLEIEKHRYAFPLDADMRQQLALRVQPYPKALVAERDRSAESGTRRPPAGGVHSFYSNRAGTTCEGTLRNDPVAPLVHEAAH